MVKNAQASQNFVPVKEIRDGVMILKDGGIRAVLMASSINLSLKSETEQEAIISQFRAFLNSIDFSMQIIIQSRKLDIRPYLKLLEEREKEIDEEMLRIQTREYINFIRDFTETVNIMTKTFFIVVPYNSPAINAKSGISGLFFGKSNPSSKNAKENNFEESRTQLEQRISVVSQGLARVGIRTEQLKTEEVIEVLFKAFNIGESEGMLAEVPINE